MSAADLEASEIQRVKGRTNLFEFTETLPVSRVSIAAVSRICTGAKSIPTISSLPNYRAIWRAFRLKSVVSSAYSLVAKAKWKWFSWADPIPFTSRIYQKAGRGVDVCEG